MDDYASASSASASALELAATIAGAITIPTKAIAIMRSCTVFSPLTGLEPCPLFDIAVDGEKAKSHEDRKG